MYPFLLPSYFPKLFINRPRRKCSFKSERDYVRKGRDLAMLFGVETSDFTVTSKKIKNMLSKGYSRR